MLTAPSSICCKEIITNMDLGLFDRKEKPGSLILVPQHPLIPVPCMLCIHSCCPSITPSTCTSHHVRACAAVMESIRTRFLGDGLGQWMSAFPQCCQPVFKQMLPVFHHAETATPFSMGFIVLHLERAKEGDWLEEFVLSADY